MNERERARWTSGEGASGHARMLSAIQHKEFAPSLTPFSICGGYYDMRGFSVSSLREVADCAFQDTELSKAVFSSIYLSGCDFRNVRFDSADLSHISDFGNRFEKCSFQQVDFRGATIGGQGSSFSDCDFDRCTFRNAAFLRPEFSQCTFRECDLRGVDFNGSSFVECTFAGALYDVWFRGGFAYPTETERFGVPRKNTMLRVSFTDATLMWVTFSNHCDLSTIVLPDDGHHRLYDHWKGRMERASDLIRHWDEEPRTAAANYLRTFQVHAQSQSWNVLNDREVIEELGEQVGARLLEALGHPFK